MPRQLFPRIGRAAYLALFTLALCLLSLSPRLLAQGGLATVTGTVHDISGGVIPKAQVTLVNQSSGESRQATSNNSGFFSFVGVPQGLYAVTVSRAGFATLHQTNIAVNAYGNVSIPNLNLKPGSVTQTVSVKGTAYYAVPLNSSAKKEVITAKQIQNTVIEGRGAVELLKILPGVVNTGYNAEVAGYGQGVGSFSVNGERTDALAITFDGADNIDPGCNCGNVAPPDVDMISQVTVQTSNFSAENAKGPVVISTTTKAGSRDFHGEAYYSTRLHQLNANDWQGNRFHTARPLSDFYYPGFNIGGPVLIPGTSFNKHRNKMFFFVGYEYMKQGLDPGLHEAFVPTPAMRQGNFNNIGPVPSPAYEIGGNPCPKANSTYCSGVGQLNPAYFDPGGVALFKMYPLPNANPATNLGYNYVSEPIAPTNHATLRGRLDYDFTQNTKLYVTLDHDSETALMPYGLWWGGSDVPFPGNETGSDHSFQETASLINVLSPTMTNEVQFASSRLVLPNAEANPNADSRSALGFPYHGLYGNNSTNYMPMVTDWGGGVANLCNACGSTIPVTFANKWLNDVRDDLSWVKGNHLLKMGVYYEHVTNDQPSGDPRGEISPTPWGIWNGTTNTGNAYANLLLGDIGWYSQSSTQLTGNMADNEFDGYIQDSWRATPRLTLNYGVRLYHMGWMYDKHGRIASFVPSAYQGPLCNNPGVYGCGTGTGQNPVGGGTAGFASFTGVESNALTHNVPSSGFPTPAISVGPHFGFALDLTGHASTILRGGVGAYFFRDQGNVFFGAIANPPYLENSTLQGGYTFAQLDNPANIPGIGASSLNTLNSTDNHVPVTYNYSLTLSEKIPFQTVMEISYVGNDSSHQVLPATGNGGFNFNAIPQGAELAAWQTCGTNGNPACSNIVDQNYRPYQNYQTIQLLSHMLSQNYNSLQITLNRTTGNLSYSAAYTFSKALGIGGEFDGNGGTSAVDPFNYRGRSYGPLPYDRTQTLSIAYNYMMPNLGTRYLGNNFIADGVLNGWQLSGISQFQSGFPMAPGMTGSNINLNANYITGTPDTTVHMFLVCNPTSALQPQQIYNANCFKSPTQGNNGDYQLPYIHAPAFISNDLGIFKNFGLGKSESRKIQVRIEGFNFLNHANWVTSGMPNLNFAAYGAHATNLAAPTSNTTTPGYLSQKFGHRIMELEVKYIF